MRYAAYADVAIESLQQAGMAPAAFMVDSAFQGVIPTALGSDSFGIHKSVCS